MSREEPLEWLAAHLLAPFASAEAMLSRALGVLRAFGLDLESKTALPYLVSSLLIAWALHRIGRARGLTDGSTSFAGFAFPRHVYSHRSAVADYKFVLVDLTIKGFLYVPAVSVTGWLAYKALTGILGHSVADSVAELPFSVAFAPVIASFLLADFAFFLAHYLMHRIPFLWYFHEVHHSAEVLTPVTVYRVHPVEDLVNAVVGGVVTALGAAVYSSVSAERASPETLMGVSAIMCAYFLFAFQLRHSHIWFSYGRALSHFFISPAQHQIHHSKDAKHWNRNYGFVLAIWDWLWGSLYVPKEREALSFGVPGASPADFESVGRMYLLPFKKATARLMPSATR